MRAPRVHRPGYMDYIGVLQFDAKGQPVAEQRFLGLYTSSAYNRRPWEIPLVRERHDYVMRQSGLRRDGHSGKALRHILETLPRDELFQSNEDELLRDGDRHPRRCRSACAASCSCGATATVASSRRWSTSRATASTPKCATASKTMLKRATAWRAASTRPCRWANRRWRSCT